MSEVCEWCANMRELWNSEGALEECFACHSSPSFSAESADKAMNAALAVLGLL